jgi:hypothetical protein
MIEIVTASINDAVLHQNLLDSIWVEEYDVHIQRGYNNVPKAYNAVKTSCPLVIYVHDDVYLPSNFQEDLLNTLKRLPDDWGVIGCAGVKLIDGKKLIKGYIKDRGNIWGAQHRLPAEVDTLDEMLLITRGDLCFDEQFPLDFYGADICMQARAQGRKCFAINAYCEHNSSRPPGGRTPAFYEAEKKFREKWIDYLPIATTCSLIQ